MGKANVHRASRKMRIIDADELLFPLLRSSGDIRPKIGLPLSGIFSLLFFLYVIAVVLVGAHASVQSE